MKMLNSPLAKTTGGQTRSHAEAAGESRRGARNEIFDNLARTLGGTIPRRTALKLAVLGVVGAALSEFGVKSAWAQNCLCNGQPYNPTTACCTPFGVQPKHPIINLAACPNKVPHPGHPQTPNGCGPAGAWYTPLIPNRWGLANFTTCCNTHDNCYGRCNDPKGGCDTDFLGCLRDACFDAYLPLFLFPHLLASCLVAAQTYYEFVNRGGGSAYSAAQSGACDCCGTQSCTQTCAGSACGSLPSCAPGGDCVCFTSVEGTGACVHGSTPCSSVPRCTTTADCPSGYACLTTSCCGPFGVCGPLCNPIVPAGANSASNFKATSKDASQAGEPTLGGF